MAAAAGVSVTTVSHILNEVEGKRVNTETRQRVLQTARQLGYAPNGLARGRRLKRSSTIGFVSDQIATTPPGRAGSSSERRRKPPSTTCCCSC
ncbi:LacI family DNA-binding transcriptional regulator [Streptomyces sp. NPDC006290]|uniref:LacI family DNA-binding transcriptional regulator n=1 Tax=Streptomyces sp. NPDC006290 TaxID=3156745 RepID=UPI0033AD2591